MLILTRRINETLVIGDDVTVTILEVTGNQIRIGIDAPKDVEVHRLEIYNRIRSEQGKPLKTAVPGLAPYQPKTDRKTLSRNIDRSGNR